MVIGIVHVENNHQKPSDSHIIKFGLAIVFICWVTLFSWALLSLRAQRHADPLFYANGSAVGFFISPSSLLSSHEHRLTVNLAPQGSYRSNALHRLPPRLRNPLIYALQPLIRELFYLESRTKCHPRSRRYYHLSSRWSGDPKYVEGKTTRGQDGGVPSTAALRTRPAGLYWPGPSSLIDTQLRC